MSLEANVPKRQQEGSANVSATVFGEVHARANGPPHPRGSDNPSRPWTFVTGVQNGLDRDIEILLEILTHTRHGRFNRRRSMDLLMQLEFLMGSMRRPRRALSPAPLNTILQR
jgi:hypothetical protein